jgi:hypothetical protein
VDYVELEGVVRNLNDRFGRIEQILPTLATKEDLKAYATKDDVRAEGELTRQHFNAVAERLETKIQVIAEGQVALQDSFEGLRKEVKGGIAHLDRRVTRLEARESRPPRPKSS